ncbi:hypothetical protein [Microbacterium sp.]|uniref:hypothetical protein n=1 Tax=Microbacterium sp. TaxID=51671 RepID=UPI003A89ED00
MGRIIFNPATTRSCRQILDAGALDEIAISIAPVLLTGGAPLLPRRVESDRLRLVSANAVGQFARVVYAVAPPPAAEPGRDRLRDQRGSR